MAPAGANGEVMLEELRGMFPRWQIFAAEGSWWAVRGGSQQFTGPESLLLRALKAPDLDGLANRLCLQEWLDGLDAAGLEAVWKATFECSP